MHCVFFWTVDIALKNGAAGFQGPALNTDLGKTWHGMETTESAPPGVVRSEADVVKK